jgi:PII-like signaling protein
MNAQPARILRIHVSESDRCQGEPLFEAIVAKCRELQIAGATVFQGLEGFGESAELHRGHLLRHDFPIVIAIVDTAENLDRLLPAVEAMIDTGVLAMSEVEMIRVQKPAR